LLAFGGFASIFLLVGAFGLIFAGRLVHSKDLKEVMASAPQEPLPTGGPVVLLAKYTPMGRFTGILIGALFWNGFMAVFTYFFIFADNSEKVPLPVKIFIGLFWLIGAGLVVGVIKNFLALFNPRLRLVAQSTVIRLGEEFRFSWTISGQSSKLRKLRIVLEGREEVTYRRGTSTSTDTKVFAEIPVFETMGHEVFDQGSAGFIVPPGHMHTFEGGNNKVLWRLRVRGEIPRWPDVDDEYPVTVLPQPTRKGSNQ
jgi:hypothetical protein